MMQRKAPKVSPWGAAPPCVSLTEGVRSRSVFLCLGFPRRPCICMPLWHVGDPAAPARGEASPAVRRHVAGRVSVFLFVPGHLPRFVYLDLWGWESKSLCFRAVSVAAHGPGETHEGSWWLNHGKIRRKKEGTLGSP